MMEQDSKIYVRRIAIHKGRVAVPAGVRAPRVGIRGVASAGQLTAHQNIPGLRPPHSGRFAFLCSRAAGSFLLRHSTWCAAHRQYRSH